MCAGCGSTLKNDYNKHMINYLYAQVLLKADNEDEAVKYLQEAIKLNPKGWRSNNAKKLLQDLE
jgi:predicted Zn-dependent protease